MKKNISNDTLINEMKQTLNPKKGLIESIVFDEENYDTENDNPGYDFGADDDFDMPEENEEQPMKGNSMVKDVIDKIRLLSLQGIQKLASNPDGVEYDTLKKIWQLCDKTVTMPKDAEMK